MQGESEGRSKMNDEHLRHDAFCETSVLGRLLDEPALCSEVQEKHFSEVRSKAIYRSIVEL